MRAKLIKIFQKQVICGCCARYNTAQADEISSNNTQHTYINLGESSTYLKKPYWPGAPDLIGYERRSTILSYFLLTAIKT